MPSDILIRLINLSLRAATLACKFLLIFFLAKYLEPSDVGVYGLLVATIGYAFFVVGFEFYTYASRELIGADRRQWLPIIRDQWVFFMVAYACFTPVLLLIFFFDFLPSKYLFWFVALFLLEHTAQELNRLLVAMSEQFLASLVLFLRSGIWCIVVVFLMWFFPEMRTLDCVLFAWCLGAATACLLGGARLLRLDRSRIASKVGWCWIYKGIKISLPLLVASLAIRGLFTFDRYWVESSVGLDVLGAYILFAGIAFSIVSFLDAGVIAFLYPRVVAAAKANDVSKFRQYMRELLVNVVVATLIMAVAALLMSPYVLSWVNKPVYADYFFLLRWLLLAISIYAFSMIPHVGLYAKHKDTAILWSQLAGLLVFLLGCLVGSAAYGALAVVWSMCLSFSVILIWKCAAYYRVCICRVISK